MKHSILQVIALAMMLVLVAAAGSACSAKEGTAGGKGLSPADVLAEPDAPGGAPDTLTKLGVAGAWRDMEFSEAKGDLVRLSATAEGENGTETPYTLIYNLASGSTLYLAASYELDEPEDDREPVRLMGMNTYLVVDKTGASTLYGSDGGFLLHRKEEEIRVYDSTRLIKAGYQTWKLLENGSLEEVTTPPSTAMDDVKELEVQRYTEDYVHVILEDAAYVYEENGRLAAFYRYPAVAVNRRAWALQNGSLLIQYVEAVEEPEGTVLAETDYDLVYQSAKWRLHTLLLSVETGETTELDFPYVVRDIDTRYSYNQNGVILTDKLDNLAILEPIQQKHIATQAIGSLYAGLTNQGAVQELTRWQADQMGLPLRISKDRYILSTQNERKYLYSGKGKLIADVTGSSVLSARWILTDRAVFDLDGDLLLDYGERDWQWMGASSGGMLFCKEEGSGSRWYLFAGDKPVEVPATSLHNLSYTGCYIFYSEDTDAYSVWGGDKKLGTLDQPLYGMYAVENGVLMFNRNAAGMVDVYYAHNTAEK